MHFVAAVMAALLLAACAGDVADPSRAAPGDIEGSWQLTAGRMDNQAVPIVESHPITLTIEGSRLGGRAACNEYGARIIAAGDGIELEELAWTAMACMPDEVMAAESAYVAALEAVRGIIRDGDALVLRGPALELRYERLPDPPTAELTDVEWKLETVFVGDIAAEPMGEPATLLLRSDGAIEGSTGCRTFTGQWIERGEQIHATSLAMDDRECPRQLSEQDSHVVQVIGDGFVPTIDGDLLTLIDPGGVGLVYRSGA
jgi:heat shock protein HslJ